MSIKKKTVAFWQYFLKQKDQIQRILDGNDSNEIKQMRDALSDKLIEFAGCYLDLVKNEDGYYECIFLPETDKTSQLISLYLKKFAPKVLADEWIISDCLPAMSDKAMHLFFKVQDLIYTVEDIQIAFDVYKEHECVDIWVGCDAFEWMNEAERDTIGMTFVKQMMGDMVYQYYIREIKTSEKLKEDKIYIPLMSSYEALLDLIEENNWKDYHDLIESYHVYKLDQEVESEDLMKDRVLISTMYPGLFTEYNSKDRTCCNQMNRLGGEFGVLVYEINQFDENESIRKRALEKELNTLLYDLGIARMIGSAIGKKHIYFEIAIFDRDDFKKACLTLAKQGFLFQYLPY